MEMQQPNEPLAIIGIGCRFPGGASSPEAFWKLLLDGVDAICDVPDDRWDQRKFYDPRTDAAGTMDITRGPDPEFESIFIQSLPGNFPVIYLEGYHQARTETLQRHPNLP